jgi:hypothetical protein
MSIKTESLSPPRRFLVDDDIVVFASYKRDHKVRMRIWRGKDAITVVLVSQVDGDISPALNSTSIANKVFSHHLGYPDNGMLYFEDFEIPSGGRCLQQVYFEYIGCGLRRQLFKPIARVREWGHIEYVVGEKVEQ